jgi:hypothetical protein
MEAESEIATPEPELVVAIVRPSRKVANGTARTVPLEVNHEPARFPEKSNAHFLNRPLLMFVPARTTPLDSARHLLSIVGKRINFIDLATGGLVAIRRTENQ